MAYGRPQPRNINKPELTNMEQNPYAPPTTLVARDGMSLADSNEPAFFAVSISKLLVMSICSLGLYQVYWFYKNWSIIKARGQLDIFPAPRAIFAVFFCYQCFRHIRDFVPAATVKSSVAAGPLATAWIVATLAGRLPGLYWLISMLSVLFLVPVQSHINQVNAAVQPDHDRNDKFTAANWLVIVLGVIVLGLALVGSTVPT